MKTNMRRISAFRFLRFYEVFDLRSPLYLIIDTIIFLENARKHVDDNWTEILTYSLQLIYNEGRWFYCRWSLIAR